MKHTIICAVLLLVAPAHGQDAPWSVFGQVGALTGGTSNLEQTQEGSGEALMQIEGSAWAQGFDRRLRIQGNGSFRQPLTGAELRQGRGHLTVDYGHPLADGFEIGASSRLAATEQVVLFNEAGVLPRGRSRRSIGGRTRPRVAWTQGPWRLEVDALLSRKGVSGADDFHFTDLGGGGAVRWSQSPDLWVRVFSEGFQRQFDQFLARDRFGDFREESPTLSLAMTDFGVELGSAPDDVVQVNGRLVARRTWDTFDGFHSGWRVSAEGGLSWVPERRLNLDLGGWASQRTYHRRQSSPGVPTSEFESGGWLSMGWRLPRGLMPQVRYEANAAFTDVDAALYTEHVLLMGVQMLMQ
ncbi:MAG: hypothetical protein ACE366_17690 [Bradymonadia bacterium]